MANRLILGRFQATTTGSVNEIRVYSLADGNIKVAIFDDDGGRPGETISYSDTVIPVTANQWNAAPIAATGVTQGDYYWLAVANDYMGAISFNRTSGSGTSMGKTITFSNFSFADPLGTDFKNYSYERAFAGWGTTGTPSL